MISAFNRGTSNGRWSILADVLQLMDVEPGRTLSRYRIRSSMQQLRRAFEAIDVEMRISFHQLAQLVVGVGGGTSANDPTRTLEGDQKGTVALAPAAFSWIVSPKRPS